MQMRSLVVAALVVFVAAAVAGCARTWQFTPIDAYLPTEQVPQATVCRPCHQAQYDTWASTRHGSGTHMAVVPEGLRSCGACHSNVAAHAANPAVRPGSSPAKLSKTEQNTLCGKCHYNQDLFKGSAINPRDKHALFMNVGFEGREKQIGCLDCHAGHQDRANMLRSIQAHVCFSCHKEAIVTMGVFQPFNYLFFGKACQACHTVHGGSAASQATRMGVGFCIVCHFAGTALVGD
jgi:predicted CXXCH cytochrome family protein